jgi:hypothetical protein
MSLTLSARTRSSRPSAHPPRSPIHGCSLQQWYVLCDQYSWHECRGKIALPPKALCGGACQRPPSHHMHMSSTVSMGALHVVPNEHLLLRSADSTESASHSHRAAACRMCTAISGPQSSVHCASLASDAMPAGMHQRDRLLQQGLVGTGAHMLAASSKPATTGEHQTQQSWSCVCALHPGRSRTWDCRLTTTH